MKRRRKVGNREKEKESEQKIQDAKTEKGRSLDKKKATGTEKR